jgi:5-methylcytosine-specific restriction endonuclease McrA
MPYGVQCACERKAAAERKARFDKKRPNSSQRGYTGRWERESKAFLRHNPYCQNCKTHLDLDTPRAAVVDHIKPHRGDQTLFWDKANWQGLCTPCHSGAKQREERSALRKESK